MSYASDNCRDGFSLVVTRQCEYIIKIYSVVIFPLVALLHRSLARFLCERTLRRKYLQTVPIHRSRATRWFRLIFDHSAVKIGLYR